MRKQASEKQGFTPTSIVANLDFGYTSQLSTLYDDPYESTKDFSAVKEREVKVS